MGMSSHTKQSSRQRLPPMLETDLPNPGNDSKSHHVRRVIYQAIRMLQVHAPAYGGRHPAAVELHAFLMSAVEATLKLIPSDSPKAPTN